jgi:iron complex outermembrane receptor protein
LSPGLLLLLFTLPHFAGGTVPPSAGVTATEEGKEEGYRVIDSIVVTAEKRPAEEIDVPVSMTVLDDQSLEAGRVDKIEDLTQLVPNLNYAEYADGQYRLAYRGIGAGGFSGNPTWNTAVDGVIVPYHRAFRLLDLERVEVLRGPQGTLYGRNTTAGLINVTTRSGRGAPNDNYLASSYGTKNSYWLNVGYGGVGSEGRFAYRVAGRVAHTDGYVENVQLGRDDSHQEDDYTVRATVDWLASDDWHFKLSLTRDEYDNNADNFTFVSNPRESVLPFFGTSDGHLTLPILTVNRAWDGFSLTSISAYADASREVSFWLPIPGIRNGAQQDGVESFSQELRIASDASADGKLDWLAGVYVLDEERSFTPLTFLSDGTLAIRRPSVTDVLGLAVFGEASYTPVSRWTVTAGLRAATEEHDVEWRLNSVAGTPLQREEESFSSLLPKLVIQYQPRPRHQLYASFTRGFRAGGFDITNREDRSFDPEYTWQYELGFKGLLAGSRLQLSAAAFYIDWQDLQIVRQIEIGVLQTDNAAEATSVGGELELAWVTAAGVDLRFFGGYVDAEFEEYRPAPGVDFSGNTIIHVPDYSLGASASYQHDSGWHASGSLVLYGETFLNEANTLRQEPYEVLNARIGYRTAGWSVGLVGKNLLDEDYLTRGFEFGNDAIGYFADPIIVSIEASVRF